MREWGEIFKNSENFIKNFVKKHKNSQKNTKKTKILIFLFY